MSIDPINIGIKNAVITRLTTELRTDSEGNPSVDLTISGEYRTSFGRKVSEFMFWTGSYSDESKIEIPQEIKDQLKDVFNQLTPLLYDKVNHMYKELPVVASEAEIEVEPIEEVKSEDEASF